MTDIHVPKINVYLCTRLSLYLNISLKVFLSLFGLPRLSVEVLAIFINWSTPTLYQASNLFFSLIQLFSIFYCTYQPNTSNKYNVCIFNHLCSNPIVGRSYPIRDCSIQFAVPSLEHPLISMENLEVSSVSSSGVSIRVEITHKIGLQSNGTGSQH